MQEDHRGRLMKYEEQEEEDEDKLDSFIEEDFDEDDLDVIDRKNVLTRLKKKSKPHESDDEYDNYRHANEDDDQLSEVEEDEDGFHHHQVQSEDDHSEMIEIIEGNRDVLDPFDLKQIKTTEEELEIMDNDLPERYIKLCKLHMKSNSKKIQAVKEMFEKDDHTLEANWIFNRMKSQNYFDGYEDRDCKDRIRRILEFMHKEHLEVMYIYYYRKKVYSDYLNLDNLWKIEELDEEWHIFREKQKKYINLIESILVSFTEIPYELREMINHLHDPKYLKYFEDYEKFMLAKYSSNNDLSAEENAMEEEPERDRKNGRKRRTKNKAKFLLKQEFMSQMIEKGVVEELEHSQLCISPDSLCYNIIRKTQERRPVSPLNEPKEEFQRILKSSNPETDKIRFPLLSPDNRFRTISKYIAFELFSYPQLRKLLRERYFKRLVITTVPSESGNQDIDLYNMYYPVKRIKEKPVNTLKRDMWILAKQAEKMGHITLNLKFQWELVSAERIVGERDAIYVELIRNYYDLAINKHAEMWNLFRKRVISTLLNEYFIPAFMKEVKDQLTQEGERDIINACCTKLRQQLNKGPSLKESKPIKICSLVLEDTKLGVVFVDETGKVLHSFQTYMANDSQLKEFVASEDLKQYIKEFKPDMILISANCKKAQTLRKELRSPDLFTQSIFCAFGEAELPRLVAKKKIIQGYVQEQAILEAISMARLKQNPMAEIISLWSEEEHRNGILSMNLHPYQKFVNQKRLKDALERVIVEVVNLVGLNINDLKKNEHLQSQLRFVTGLGEKRSKNLLQHLKNNPSEILSRKQLSSFIKGDIVSRNCTPFLKVESNIHRSLFQKLQKEKKGSVLHELEHINLLDMTRIPEEWHNVIFNKFDHNFKSSLITEFRTRRTYSKLADQQIYILDIFKHIEKIRTLDWRSKENSCFDEQLVKTELMNRFKNTRDPERVMENRDIFFNLLRETPETLKRYMIMSVKVLSIKKNYLNVIIPENGLFGYIRLQSNKAVEEYQRIYQKGTYIKAIIIGFPFDEKNFREDQPTEEQELLKVEMALDFPHKDSPDRHQKMAHDCMGTCFPSIVKAIHPGIDLEKDRFDLRKEDKPVIQNREDRQKEKYVMKHIKPQFRRISHPKYRNISSQPAVELMKTEQNGEFVIRPSSQGSDYLVITWKFFNRVIVHIKVRVQHKGIGSINLTYRIQDRDNRSYNSLEEIVERYIKPMNQLVLDVTANRKFLDRTVEQVQNTIKKDLNSDSSHIYYYFGVSEEFPQFFLLIYMYKDKKPIRELIRVKSSGLYFHDQQFSNVRDLIAWFKEHLKEKEYQRYVKNMNLQLKGR